MFLLVLSELNFLLLGFQDIFMSFGFFLYWKKYDFPTFVIKIMTVALNAFAFSYSDFKISLSFGFFLDWK